MLTFIHLLVACCSQHGIAQVDSQDLVQMWFLTILSFILHIHQGIKKIQLGVVMGEEVVGQVDTTNSLTEDEEEEVEGNMIEEIAIEIKVMILVQDQIWEVATKTLIK